MPTSRSLADRGGFKILWAKAPRQFKSDSRQSFYYHSLSIHYQFIINSFVSKQQTLFCIISRRSLDRNQPCPITIQVIRDRSSGEERRKKRKQHQR